MRPTTTTAPQPNTKSGLCAIAWMDIAMACVTVTGRSSTSGNEMQKIANAKTANMAPAEQPAIIIVHPAWVVNTRTQNGAFAAAAELPSVAVTCEAEITLVGAAGARTICASEFFTGPLSTLRRRDEIITELKLPFWPADRRWAFREFAQRQGDFALAGIALFYDEDQDGRVRNVHVGVIGACNRPQRLTEVETMLNGHPIDDELIRQAAATAAQTVDPPEDLHAGAAYRRALVATLVERGLRAATLPRGA